MASACCVVGCKVVPSKEVTLFKVPMSKTLRQKWLAAIKAPQKLTINDSVCSEHFLKTDYESVRGKVRLKAAVVPSIFELEQKGSSPDRTSVDIIDKENVEHIPNDVKIKGMSKSKSKEEDVINDNRMKAKYMIQVSSDCQAKNRLNSDPSETQEHKADDLQNLETIREGDSKIDKNLVDYHLKAMDEVINVKDSTACESSVVGTESNATDSVEYTPQLPNPPRDIDKPQDIEDLLTNYHIKQNNIHSITEPEKFDAKDEDVVVVADDNDMSLVSSDDRVYIEVPADKDGEGKGDCIMVLENVQVDVDPSSLMLGEREADDDSDSSSVRSVRLVEKPVPQPISLLTSSDEDDVILQEPHIDTVEVSDETDEDDVPLVRLVKSDTKAGTIVETNGTTQDDCVLYICLECPFKSKDKTSMLKHRREHINVLLMCPQCGYMTSSEIQLTKHEKRHRETKQFACNHCNYRSKHKMSLQYHMKSHKVKRLKCDKCNFRSEYESEVLSHSMLCDSEECLPRTKSNSKYFECSQCFYKTDKRMYMRKHKRRMHRKDEDAVSETEEESGKRKKIASKDKDTSNKKKYSCTQCQYSTYKSSDLKRHSKRKHSGKKTHPNQ